MKFMYEYCTRYFDTRASCDCREPGTSRCTSRCCSSSACRQVVRQLRLRQRRASGGRVAGLEGRHRDLSHRVRGAVGPKESAPLLHSGFAAQHPLSRAPLLHDERPGDVTSASRRLLQPAHAGVRPTRRKAHAACCTPSTPNKATAMCFRPRPRGLRKPHRCAAIAATRSSARHGWRSFKTAFRPWRWR